MLAVACSSVDKSVPNDEPNIESQVDLVWPSAPSKPRIRYLETFSSAKDLGYSESFSSRLKNLMGGGKTPGMLRPYSIAVSEYLTAVTDPGLSAVHLFYHRKKAFRLLGAINGKHLSSPVGIALGENRLFVADSALNRVFIVDAKLRLIRELDGFQRPTGLAYHEQQKRLFVADTHAHQVMEYDENGKWIRTLGARGQNDGQFNFPTHITVHASRLYVNDTMNFRIQVFDLPTGKHIATLGEHGAGAGYIAQPKGLAINSNERIYMAESLTNRIQIFDMQDNFLLDFGNEGSAPGQFLFPAGLAVRGSRLYVADSGNHRVQVFEYYGED
jgi:DNA-binding beta-propeller fold protein YncE